MSITRPTVPTTICASLSRVGLVADRRAAEHGHDLDRPSSPRRPAAPGSPGCRARASASARAPGRPGRPDRRTRSSAARRRRSCRCRSAPGRSRRAPAAAAESSAPESGSGARSPDGRAPRGWSSDRPRSANVVMRRMRLLGAGRPPAGGRISGRASLSTYYRYAAEKRHAPIGGRLARARRAAARRCDAERATARLGLDDAADRAPASGRRAASAVHRGVYRGRVTARSAAEAASWPLYLRAGRARR